jgi:hypothetical protein
MHKGLFSEEQIINVLKEHQAGSRRLRMPGFVDKLRRKVA